jgi:PAS domain S-box-containing protein
MSFRLLQHPVLRSTVVVRIALISLIAAFSLAGYFVTSATISGDRKDAATRRAASETVRLQALLDRARASVVGLGNVLSDEPSGDQSRFAELVGSTAGSAGLVDALWVQPHPRSGRLIATFTSHTRPALQPGVDVTNWPVLADAIHNPATEFTVTASKLGSLGGERGFYLVENTDFGRPDNDGSLAVFVPGGLLTLALGDDPRQVAIRVDGQRLVGQLQHPPIASAGFPSLGRSWRTEAVDPPPSGLQSLLPWLALVWPIAVALVAFLVGNAVVRRRRAEREVERVFESALDLLGIAGLDGYWKRVNPAFERALGYSREELLSRPLLDFVHPDDKERSLAALEALRRGRQVDGFVNRQVGKNGEVHWLEWNVRPAPQEGFLYASARDITDRRQAEEEVRAARARVVTAGDETRRRIERDLHDGTQQRLVSLALKVRATEAKVPPGMDDLRSELSETATNLAAAAENLQEISRGIHPAVLSSGGLGVALKGLARRAGLPVELEVDAPRRLPDSIEVAAYYVVSEALTNAAKYAEASVVTVRLHADSIVDLEISDDGVGGADPLRGSGLLGLRDRVEALGGSIEIVSPPGGGTSMRVRIPVAESAEPVGTAHPASPRSPEPV